MAKTIHIILFFYYSLGTICLPMGNFSAIAELPEMYRHCKATEDKDMTPFDFITDHLINIDGLFDKHDNGDEQKPHQPIQNEHYSQLIAFQFVSAFTFCATNFFVEKNINPIRSDNFIPSDYISKIFRPPIV